MPFYSPLRYPGGKRRLVPVITRLLEENGLKDIQYAEPYAGGAAVALTLLLREYASVVHINDLSRDVYAFWHTVLHDAPYLCKRIEEVPITMKEWHKQRDIYEDREQRELVEVGFATLFLNRTNRSGIISGGVIGGQTTGGTMGSRCAVQQRRDHPQNRENWTVQDQDSVISARRARVYR